MANTQWNALFDRKAGDQISQSAVALTSGGELPIPRRLLRPRCLFAPCDTMWEALQRAREVAAMSSVDVWHHTSERRFSSLPRVGNLSHILRRRTAALRSRAAEIPETDPAFGLPAQSLPIVATLWDINAACTHDRTHSR
jgi:hypothetical protein